MAALEGELDRRRDQRGSAQHHRKAHPRPAGCVDRDQDGTSSDRRTSRCCATTRAAFSPRTRRSLTCASCATIATPTASRAHSGKTSSNMGWAGILVPENYRRAGTGLCRSRDRDGGAGAYAHTVAVLFDCGRWLRMQSLERATTSRRMTTCRKSPAGDLIATLAFDETAEASARENRDERHALRQSASL